MKIVELDFEAMTNTAKEVIIRVPENEAWVMMVGRVKHVITAGPMKGVKRFMLVNGYRYRNLQQLTRDYAAYANNGPGTRGYDNYLNDDGEALYRDRLDTDDPKAAILQLWDEVKGALGPQYIPGHEDWGEVSL